MGELLVMSDSKKPGQTAVLYHYCDLSRFFWIRRYNRKRTIQGEDNCFTDQNSARMWLHTSSSTYSCSERANESEFSAFILLFLGCFYINMYVFHNQGIQG